MTDKRKPGRPKTKDRISVGISIDKALFPKMEGCNRSDLVNKLLWMWVQSGMQSDDVIKQIINGGEGTAAQLKGILIEYGKPDADGNVFLPGSIKLPKLD